MSFNALASQNFNNRALQVVALGERCLRLFFKLCFLYIRMKISSVVQIKESVISDSVPRTVHGNFCKPLQRKCACALILGSLLKLIRVPLGQGSCLLIAVTLIFS